MKKKDDLDKYLEKALKRDPSLGERLKEADTAWDIAFQVYELRKKAGLTQRELADLMETKQSNIARIESGDYKSYTWKTLEKITKALKARLEIRIVPITEGQSVHP